MEVNLVGKMLRVVFLKDLAILGPLLFLIYVNDLPRSISSQVFLFADDTKLIRSISTSADHVQLQTDLDNLAKWCDAWQLNFNATKCKVIHFGRAMHSYGSYYLAKWDFIGLS